MIFLPVGLRTIRLTVTDGADSSISGAEVILTNSADEKEYTKTTNSDGEATIKVPEGSYEVVVSKSGYDDYESTTDIVVDSTHTEFTVEMEQTVIPTYTVHVDVDDGAETPVSGAAVVLTNKVDSDVTFTGTSGSAGGCNITNVPAGTYVVTASAEGYDDYTASEDLVVDSAETISISMMSSTPTFKISGVIKDEEEALISGATVTLQKGVTTVDTCTTETDGTYEFSGLAAAADYTVVVEATGYVRNDVDVAIIDGNVTKNFTLVPTTDE